MSQHSMIASEKDSADKNGSPSILALIGPGVVTGASDDDPSGIATYSQIGAQFGFSMLWTVLLCYPLMTAIQEICARLGRVTGLGLAANMRLHFPRPFLVLIVLLVAGANVINIAADISALGAACVLVLPGTAPLYALVLTVISLILQIFVPYHRYVFVLKWLTFSLISYVLTLAVVHIPWIVVVDQTLRPHLQFSADYIAGFIAVLGTTISPYLFFWQAAEEVEEELLNPLQHPLIEAPEEAVAALRRIHWDTYIGMGSASIVFYSIVLTAAVTLHPAGITNIQTAAQAAEALRPLAGNLATLLFALGIIGTGLLAIPVLSASAAYAVADAIGVPVGLERKPHEAKCFYSLIASFTLAGLSLSFLQINPMKALLWAAVVNGIAAGPIMAAVMIISQNSKWMGPFYVRGWRRAMGWTATVLMLSAAFALVATIF